MSTAPDLVSDVVDLLALGYRDVRLHELDRLALLRRRGRGRARRRRRAGPRPRRHADPVVARLRFAADRHGRQRAVGAAGGAAAGRDHARARGAGMRWPRRDRTSSAGLHVLDPARPRVRPSRDDSGGPGALGARPDLRRLRQPAARAGPALRGRLPGRRGRSAPDRAPRPVATDEDRGRSWTRGRHGRRRWPGRPSSSSGCRPRRTSRSAGACSTRWSRSTCRGPGAWRCAGAGAASPPTTWCRWPRSRCSRPRTGTTRSGGPTSPPTPPRPSRGRSSATSATPGGPCGRPGGCRSCGCTWWAARSASPSS